MERRSQFAGALPAKDNT